MNDSFSELKETEKNRKSDHNLIFAGVVILVGVSVLIGNLTDYRLENWWAFFMLIPAGGMLLSMWREYQENGRLSRKGSGTIFPAMIILTIAAIFLFNLSWTIFWPVVLIAFGLSILLGCRA
jgi:chromate transport protein ChrA